MAQGSPERAGDGLVTGAYGADPFGARLERWVADARVDEAVLSRHRTRDLTEAAALDANIAGVLADVAEIGAPLAVAVAGGRHHGWVSTLGADFVVLDPAAGPIVIVALAAVDIVSPAPRSDARGDRAVSTSLTLDRVLTELAEDREQVRVTTRGGNSTAGTLVSIGQDLIQLRVESDPPGQAYVPTGAIATIALT